MEQDATKVNPSSSQSNQRHGRVSRDNLKKKFCVTLTRPNILGYMSVDVERKFHHDLSQLKYLTSIPKGQLNYDLNHNIDKAIKRTTDENNEQITLMLKFILDQKDRLKPLLDEDKTFVTYRRSLISVMCNIYNSSPVSIVASMFKNCIYLYSLESLDEVSKRKSCKELGKFCAWGYKFEQYLLSDAPNIPPEINKPVIENEEFSIYYYSELRNHRLFYGAQIDGMLVVDNQQKDVPHTIDVEENLSFLRVNQFVELKTNREVHHRSQEFSFKKYKLLRCWCQCYLAGLRGLLVGYRNDDGIVQRVEWFDTDGIVRYCKPTWAPQKTLNYLDNFLNFIKHSFNSMMVNGDNCNTTKPLTLKFDINQHHQFSVTRLNEEGNILPNWYVDNFKS